MDFGTIPMGCPVLCGIWHYAYGMPCFMQVLVCSYGMPYFMRDLAFFLWTEEAAKCQKSVFLWRYILRPFLALGTPEKFDDAYDVKCVHFDRFWPSCLLWRFFFNICSSQACVLGVPGLKNIFFNPENIFHASSIKDAILATWVFAGFAVALQKS